MAVTLSPADQRVGDRVVIQAALFQLGEQPLSLARSTDQPGVIWVNVDLVGLNLGSDEERRVAAGQLLPELNRYCAGQLDLDMVIDLLCITDKREGERYSEGRIRSASSFQVTTNRLTEGGAKVWSGGQLMIQPVELLAGESWLITCWHRQQVYEGSGQIEDRAPVGHQELFRSVAARWAGCSGRAAQWSTAGDLGVLVLHELALSYAPAHRAVSGWLEEWELRLYSLDELDRRQLERDRDDLQQLFASMALLREWINPLNRIGIKVDLDKAWFYGCQDHEQVKNLDERVDRALRNLGELADTLRSSFGVLQVRMLEEQRERRDASQRRIEVAAAAFLVPTLIVGFYGANTKLPGEQQWSGFWEMLAVLLVLSVAAVCGVLFIQRRDRIAGSRHHRRDVMTVPRQANPLARASAQSVARRSQLSKES